MNGDNPQPLRRASAISRIDALLNVFYSVLPSVVMVVAFGVIVYAVVARHFLDQPFAGANEIAQLCAVWIVMLGCARAVHNDAMIVVGILPARVEERVQRPLTMPRLVVYLATLAGITWPSLVMLGKTTQEFEALGISKVWGVAALPSGFILVFLTLLVRTLRHEEAIR